ncbi:acyl-CoA thioesterase [Riemerella columbina]|uniref:acyl-CoA thioesterase n=1 Tax=Riemerella columbina TaxID=103810 RepID=UPI000379C27D|nr:acyl-CoA thioesterase [Riemerella columbina]
MEKEFSTLVKIRFADCDPLGHLNNVKYLEYMLNAREDHVEEHYGFSYEDYAKKHGCLWVAVQNQIAYLKEVKANQMVLISSKTIEIGERTATVEILMTDLDKTIVFSVLWVKVIYFNLKTRKSEPQPKEIIDVFSKYLIEVPEQHFSDRADTLRKNNKS